MRSLKPSLAQTCALLTTLTTVSATTYPTRFDNVTWDDDNWRLTTTYLDQGHYQSRMSLANGYLGINVAAAGPFFEVDVPVNNDNINGWPLFDRRQTFATIAGFYDAQERTNSTNYPWLYQYGAESVISGIPHWAGLVVEAGSSVLDASVDPSSISGFESTLDIGAGLMSWKYDWKPAGNGSVIAVEYSIFVHKLYVNQAVVQLKLTASRDVNVTVYDVLEGEAAKRTDFREKKFEAGSPTIWSAVSPLWVGNVTAYVYSTLAGNEAVDLEQRKEVEEGRFGGNQSTIAQAVPVKLSAGETAIIEKYIGAASSDAFADPKSVASTASLKGAKKGYSALLHSHIKEWESILSDDSVDTYYLPNGTLPDDENIRELQITAVTNPFHILQNTVGENAIKAAGNNSKLDVNSISVCGLGADCYAGLVFWDAEVWMAPGLQVSHPYAMKQIVQYRVEKYGQAQENVKMAYSSSQNSTSKFSPGGAVYPWTSGRYGNCTGTGPCFDYEYHINGDIGLEMYNYYATTGDEAYFKNTLLPIYNSIAYFFAELLTYNETDDTYVLQNATDPDEYANNVDNPGFTVALIQEHLNTTMELNAKFGLEVNSTWAEKVSKLQLPVNTDANIILEYGSMNGSISVKQADVVLLDDMLDYPNPYSLSDLDYYAAKQSPFGPGMTYGVFSIVANEISPSGCSSYTYDLYSSQPYARAPWFQFSEQLVDDFEANGGTHPAFPFLTGMGGANRVAIFGYLGLRLFVDRLDIDPSLPPQITSLKYRTIHWQGHAIRAYSNTTHTVLTRLNTSLPHANPLYKSHPIPVTLGTRPGNYSLSYTTPLTIPNRLIGQTKTQTGNILQCESRVSSSSPFTPGQFPLSAIDGAASTKWQPASANSTAWLIVDLSGRPFVPVKEVRFDWGTTPPSSYTVLFSNSSTVPSARVLESGGVGVRDVTASDTVEVSAPWDVERVAVIEAVRGNKTNVTLESEVWSGRWAVLGVKGVSGGGNGEEGAGATVAEWSLIAEE